jgi:hypothetical protein
MWSINFSIVENKSVGCPDPIWEVEVVNKSSGYFRTTKENVWCCCSF